MDFKGDFPVGSLRCHPLTVLDDHSRFSVCLKACDNERTDTVKDSLVSVFRCYGLPDCILMDNGSPFGDDAASPFTRLGAGRYVLASPFPTVVRIILRPKGKTSDFIER